MNKIEARRKKVKDLRDKGYTISKIAGKLKVSNATVQRDLNALDKSETVKASKPAKPVVKTTVPDDEKKPEPVEAPAEQADAEPEATADDVEPEEVVKDVVDGVKTGLTQVIDSEPAVAIKSKFHDILGNAKNGVKNYFADVQKDEPAEPVAETEPTPVSKKTAKKAAEPALEISDEPVSVRSIFRSFKEGFTGVTSHQRRFRGRVNFIACGIAFIAGALFTARIFSEWARRR